jgi:rhodanese-related sulfurtransferase
VGRGRALLTIHRQRDGELPGALIIDRNVLGWRLDPTCPHRIAEADTANRRMIIVCNEGYSSSLAAESLRQLGIERATDLVVGFHAWKRFSAQAKSLSRKLTPDGRLCGRV